MFLLLFHIFFFFNDTATTEIYTYGHTLSLHDVLPILSGDSSGDIGRRDHRGVGAARARAPADRTDGSGLARGRSEEHTSELQSLMRISYAVFCLKKQTTRKQKKSITKTHIEPITHSTCTLVIITHDRMHY